MIAVAVGQVVIVGARGAWSIFTATIEFLPICNDDNIIVSVPDVIGMLLTATFELPLALELQRLLENVLVAEYVVLEVFD